MPYQIMIVDDEPLIRQGMLKIIDWQSCGFEVSYVADSAFSALEYLQEHTVDVVLTDITMPRMDGLSFIAEVRARGLDPLFIILSGYNEFEYARQAILLDVSNYLLKPLSPDDLIQSLQTILPVLDERKKDVPGFHRGLAFLYRISSKSLLINMLSFVEENMADNMSLDRLANQFFLSPNHISALFRQELAINFIDILTIFRMEKAKWLLLHDAKLKIYEVANLVGYKSARYFSRMFAETVGVMPHDYRNTHLRTAAATAEDMYRRLLSHAATEPNTGTDV